MTPWLDYQARLLADPDFLRECLIKDIIHEKHFGRKNKEPKNKRFTRLYWTR